MSTASSVADDLFRREGARLVAILGAHLGTHRLQLAEDAVQEALVRALQPWPCRGIPDNPAAWLTLAATNLALDTLRREQTWQRKEASTDWARILSFYDQLILLKPTPVVAMKRSVALARLHGPRADLAPCDAERDFLKHQAAAP